MQNAYPDYYPLFHCIADRCRHNCCIGWEIDVDGDSLAAYDQIGGEMGERLHKCIDRSGEMPHFLLGEQERCPFLNGKNLCDLILYGGEGMLCQICTDHPRYRSFFSERTEIGVGLCCEEAARLILTRPEKTMLVTTGEGELDEEGTALLTLRDHRTEPRGTDQSANRADFIGLRCTRAGRPACAVGRILSLARAHGRGVDGHFGSAARARR